MFLSIFITHTCQSLNWRQNSKKVPDPDFVNFFRNLHKYLFYGTVEILNIISLIFNDISAVM